MKKLIIHAAIVLIFAGSFSSCTEKSENDFSEPIEIPITEYSLYETGCWLTNLKIDDKVIIINSKKELEKLITCTDVDYPDIDFSKHTLLFTRGASTTGVAEVNSIFLQVGSKKYIWKVTVRLNMTQVAQGWYAIILAPKLTNNATIVSEIQQLHF